MPNSVDRLGLHSILHDKIHLTDVKLYFMRIEGHIPMGLATGRSCGAEDR